MLIAEQSVRVEENMALVTWVINKYFPMLRGDADVFQEGCIGLCRAARIYDPAKGAFATIAVRCILSQLRFNHRAAHVKKRTGLQFISPIYHNSDGEEFSVFEKIAADCAVEETVVNHISILELTRVLSERQKRVICYLWRGLTQQQIAQRLGVSQVCIWRDISKIRQTIV